MMGDVDSAPLPWLIGIIDFFVHRFMATHHTPQICLKYKIIFITIKITNIFRHRHPDPDETCKQGNWSWKWTTNSKKVARGDWC